MNVTKNIVDSGYTVAAGDFTKQVDSLTEAITMMQKIETARAIVEAVQALATPCDLSAGLVAEYFDVGGFTDEDVAALGVTADDVANCITLLQQVDALMTGGDVTPAVYRSTLNHVRRVK